MNYFEDWEITKQGLTPIFNNNNYNNHNHNNSSRDFM